MPAGLSCVKRDDKGALCACLGPRLVATAKSRRNRGTGASASTSCPAASLTLPFLPGSSRLQPGLYRNQRGQGPAGCFEGRHLFRSPSYQNSQEIQRPAPAALRLPKRGPSSQGRGLEGWVGVLDQLFSWNWALELHHDCLPVLSP